jgi:multiple sugar transport system substrate-binding protein
VQGKIDDDVLRGINSGHPPDLALLGGPQNLAKFCDSGALRDIGAVARKDHLDLSATFPKQVLTYSSYGGKTCALPLLTDAFGLYYNKALLAKAGYHHPPRTLSELTTMAKKLTTYNKDGSIKVAGFVPLSTFYESAHALQGNYFGASWYHNGASVLGTDSAWVRGLDWEKSLIKSIGYDKLSKFAATLGAESEFASNNGFETGKVAMMIDGEWRVAFATADKTKVDYATAPFPADNPARYGSGQIGGTLIGIPAGVKHPSESWLAMRYLATNTSALNQLSAGLKNVPTTFASLRTSKFSRNPLTRTFAQILQNKHSSWKQPTTAGQVDIDLLTAFEGKWEAGQVGDLRGGLRQLAKDINTQTAIR